MNRLHGIIFAYDQRTELRELTERRTGASMPFGGRYRAVDFALSNLLNAGVTDVGLVLHGRYQSMLDHVGSGKVWDMSRKRGGLHLLPPFNYLHDWGVTPFRGKMEVKPMMASRWKHSQPEPVSMIRDISGPRETVRSK